MELLFYITSLLNLCTYEQSLIHINSIYKYIYLLYFCLSHKSESFVVVVVIVQSVVDLHEKINKHQEKKNFLIKN